MPLKDAKFSDIYVGKTKSHMKGVPGTKDPLPVPDQHAVEVAEIRAACEKYVIDNPNRPDFAIRHGDVSYRASIMPTIQETVFVMRRLGDTITPLSELGIPPKYIELMMEQDMTGLFVVSGAFGQGKTTTASSLVASRIAKYGGVAVTVEEPPEMPLHGPHGDGVCYQTEVLQGGFGQACRQAARWSPSIMFLGEIRDSETALESLRAAINGKLVVCTAHSDNVPMAIERIFQLACAEGNSADDILSMMATGLTAVLHQKLIPEGDSKQLMLEALFVTADESAIRSTVRQRKFDQIANLVTLQKNRILAASRRG